MMKINSKEEAEWLIRTYGMAATDEMIKAAKEFYERIGEPLPELEYNPIFTGEPGRYANIIIEKSVK